jgi:hypothetical protein
MDIKSDKDIDEPPMFFDVVENQDNQLEYTASINDPDMMIMTQATEMGFTSVEEMNKSFDDWGVESSLFLSSTKPSSQSSISQSKLLTVGQINTSKMSEHNLSQYLLEKDIELAIQQSLMGLSSSSINHSTTTTLTTTTATTTSTTALSNPINSLQKELEEFSSKFRDDMTKKAIQNKEKQKFINETLAINHKAWLQDPLFYLPALSHSPYVKPEILLFVFGHDLQARICSNLSVTDLDNLFCALNGNTFSLRNLTLPPYLKKLQIFIQDFKLFIFVDSYFNLVKSSAPFYDPNKTKAQEFTKEKFYSFYLPCLNSYHTQDSTKTRYGHFMKMMGTDEDNFMMNRIQKSKKRLFETTMLQKDNSLSYENPQKRQRINDDEEKETEEKNHVDIPSLLPTPNRRNSILNYKSRDFDTAYRHGHNKIFSSLLSSLPPSIIYNSCKIFSCNVQLSEDSIYIKNRLSENITLHKLAGHYPPYDILKMKIVPVIQDIKVMASTFGNMMIECSDIIKLPEFASRVAFFFSLETIMTRNDTLHFIEELTSIVYGLNATLSLSSSSSILNGGRDNLMDWDLWNGFGVYLHHGCNVHKKIEKGKITDQKMISSLYHLHDNCFKTNECALIGIVICQTKHVLSFINPQHWNFFKIN